MWRQGRERGRDTEKQKETHTKRDRDRKRVCRENEIDSIVPPPSDAKEQPIGVESVSS